jgi:hypothetical protein
MAKVDEVLPPRGFDAECCGVAKEAERLALPGPSAAKASKSKKQGFNAEG